MTATETRNVDVALLREREARLTTALQSIDKHFHGLEKAKQDRELALARVRATLALVEGSGAPDERED
jgi:hypothetical protein